MFVATVINFLLFGLNTGAQVATFIVFIRKAFILDTDYPLSEGRLYELLTNVLRNVNLFGFWVGAIPVSIKLSLPDAVQLILGGDISQRPHCNLEGLGPLPRSTVGSPHTIYYVDWSRG